MDQQILIIDDDEKLSGMLTEYLGARGLDCSAAANASDGLEMLASGTFDAVVLDVMLPDMDGFDVCREIRRNSGIPILMLTGRGDEMDRIIGLEIGADDYLPKPFNPRELLARLHAILRRAQPRAPVAPTDVMRFGALEIDRGRREVRLHGEVRALTSHQFELLRVLAERPGRVQSREQLMEAVRGEALELYDRSIDVHISRIRAAIEDEPGHPKRIKTVRAAGYVFTGVADG
ncbi:MAG: response regulator transcription factor [Myxococcales bacterium]|nr:response regulator transcription factor [Myxococcales bacterium]